ncbi:MAG TPA: malonyl-ACP O-methyltransferase BioC [Accumulibacter sp.]|nr:malonyl-ACP O-methyltransferase BioC [Accumulibacter sp.]
MAATKSFVDRRQVQRNFARAANSYDEAAFLQREISTRLLERLDYVRLSPTRIIDLGCGTGTSLNALQQRYPQAALLGIDFSAAMLRVARAQGSRLRWLLPFLRSSRPALLTADAAALPCRSQSAALVWSNLMLPWIDDPQSVFREVHRVLETGGLLMFSTVGPDTLKELRSSFSDGQIHTQRFIDMHDYGDMLVDCGFADPVMDAEMLTLTYPDFDALLADLRSSGSGCVMQQRQRGLTGKHCWANVRQNYARLTSDGRWPATVEVVYGHAWKTETRKTTDGRSIIRFDPKQRLR